MLERLANRIAEILIITLRAEYRLQGHKLTGKLQKSIEKQVRITSTGANIKILMESYGIILNNGVPTSRIPYNPNKRTGAGRSLYIQGLELFARQRFGVSGREALNIAFAIARKHAQQGMPTKASRRYSATGRRTGAIEVALEKTEDEIQELATEFLEEIIISNLAA